MQLNILKAKIHRATVTHAELHYEGSCAIDGRLLDISGIREYEQVHIFNARVMPPKQVASIKLRDQPGWITFSLDGRYAYPSTGEVIDTRTRKIVAALTDEEQRVVQSEKVVEVVMSDGRPVRNGDQFGIGRKK